MDSESNLTDPVSNDMLDLHRHFGARRVWERYDVPKSPTLSVTELWCHDEPQTQTSQVVESRTVSSYDLDSWLKEPATKYIHSENRTRVLRIVWVGLDPSNHRESPSNRDLQRLLSAWNLQDGYDYALSCFAGVSALPPAEGENTRVFTAAYHPKLALAWSHTPHDSSTCRSGSTRRLSSTETRTKPTINMVLFAQGEERTNLLSALKSRWSPELLTSPIFPAFLCSLVLAQDLDSTLDEIKGVVRNVEARTGHHRFSTRRQIRPAAGELGSLSAEMSGCAAKLANGTRKLRVIEALNSFIVSHDDNNTTVLRPERGIASRLPEISTLLAHRAEMQSVDITYVQQRVQVQIAALFHLIAQQDNAIAFETANATRSIAKDSLQDSSSMKMLALVAMFFLPGSFVAALFSAPLFEWDGQEGDGGTTIMAVATRPGFRLFWAVAVPLTVGTFLLYGVWIWLQKRRMRRRLKVDFV